MFLKQEVSIGLLFMFLKQKVSIGLLFMFLKQIVVKQQVAKQKVWLTTCCFIKTKQEDN